MFYRPKYCCNCGEKVERIDWKLWSSSRFCELCETEFKPQEWLPRAVVLIGVVSGIFGLGNYLQKSEKPPDLISGRATNVPDAGKKPVNSPDKPPVSANSTGVVAPTNAGIQKPAANQLPAARTLTSIARLGKTENQKADAPEQTYYCGAATKKGTPCLNRVKGGGRCRLHVGEPALLPAEQLVADR